MRVLCLTLTAASVLAATGGPPGGWAITIVRDPASASILYAAMHGGGVLKSIDGGRTWKPKNEGLQERTVIPIAIDGRNPAIVYAGTENGMYKSTNGGESWFEISAGLTVRNIWSVIVDPKKSERLFAGTAGGGLWRSEDGGRTWLDSGQGLKHRAVWPLAIPASRSGMMYAGTLGGGVYKSVDGGSTWMQANAGLNSFRIYSLYADEQRGILLAGTSDGVYKTSLDVAGWVRAGTELRDALVFTIGSQGTGDRALLYAATGRGLFSSKDSGDSWNRSEGDGYNPIVWGFATGPDNRLCVGTLGGGIYTSDDGGKHWTGATTELRMQIVYALAAAGSTLYAGTTGAGVYRSADGGQTWEPANQGLTKPVIKAIGVDPTNPNRVYAAAETQFMGGEGGVFRTTDGGRTWTEIGRDTFRKRVFSVAVDAADARRVFVGTEGGSIFLSRDTGRTWSQIDDGQIRERETRISAYQQAIHARPVYSIVIDPRISTVYAGTEIGVFTSKDGGKTWRESNAGLTDRRIRVLALDPKKSGTIYAGAGDLGGGGALFKSSDGGVNWRRTKLGNRWVLSLLIEPDDASIWAGTDEGLFHSPDGGETWSSVRSDASAKYVLALAADVRARHVVVAGTEGNGLFRASAK